LVDPDPANSPMAKMMAAMQGPPPVAARHEVYPRYLGSSATADDLIGLLRPAPPGRVAYFAVIPDVEPEREIAERRRRAAVKPVRWYRDGWAAGVHEAYQLGPVLAFEVKASPRIERADRRRPSGLYVNAHWIERYLYVDDELWLMEEFPEYGGR